jgi:formate hydrogenlyase subunit 3/multisubunit Na+/H+ antiporter MnhD subunit
MDLLLFAIFVPVFIGIGCIFIPRYLFKYTSIGSFVSSLLLIWGGVWGLSYYRYFTEDKLSMLQGDLFSLFMVIFAGVLSIIIAFCIWTELDALPGIFWSLFCWFTASVCGIFLSQNAIFMIVFWAGSSVISLFMIWQAVGDKFKKFKTEKLINTAVEPALIVLGMIMMVSVSGKTSLSEINIKPDTFFKFLILLILTVAALARIFSNNFFKNTKKIFNDVPVQLFLLFPAGLDKLAGIYFLKKIFVDWFDFSGTHDIFIIVLLCIISVFIIINLLYTFSEKDIIDFINIHAVVQTGYALMGFVLGSTLGVAAAVLHIISNVVCQQMLYISAGEIKRTAETTEIRKLGNLFRKLPVTFRGFSFGAAALSGLPLLSIFISMWMMFQLIAVKGRTAGLIFAIFIPVFLVGIILTIFSFIKIIYRVFLSKSSVRAVRSEMLLWEKPVLVILGLACFAAGAFPSRIIYPLIRDMSGSLDMPGMWNSERFLIFSIVLIGLGYLTYHYFGVKRPRTSQIYILGTRPVYEIKIDTDSIYQFPVREKINKRFNTVSKKVRNIIYRYIWHDFSGPFKYVIGYYKFLNEFYYRHTDKYFYEYINNIGMMIVRATRFLKK